jgi:crotonobetainyl-CoA:carnitine CoA-transferase CaiB-like acyl-CoA transferase
VERAQFDGVGALPSRLRVTDLAAASVGAAALAAAELADSAGPVAIDRRLASLWFFWTIRPIGWALPSPWNPISGDFEAADGWLKIHANADTHRAAALGVLGVAEERDAVATAVRGWRKSELEAAIVAAGGAAAELRSMAEWAEHPQGRAVAAEPLVHLDWRAGAAGDWRPDPDRPLAGIRVLDLTRVLAGPVATRFLAGLGADVLRIDPPGWDEEGVIAEVMPGKRSGFLDLRAPNGRARFESLLRGADLLVHGYRPDALVRLGYGAEFRRTVAPDLIEVQLDAYGWSGPWAGRRGFDSLVQMSAGIAEAGMAWAGSERPHPLPVQALDHATGYLMAAAALRGLGERRRSGRILAAKLSLARTAKWLVDGGFQDDEPGLADESEADLGEWIEESGWGPAKRLKMPVAGVPLRWELPATALGSSKAEWRT